MNAHRTNCFVFFLWPVSCRSLRWGKGLAGPEDVRGRRGSPRPCGKRGVSHLWREECRPRRSRCQKGGGRRRLDISPMSPGNTGTSARDLGKLNARKQGLKVSSRQNFDILGTKLGTSHYWCQTGWASLCCKHLSFLVWKSDVPDSLIIKSPSLDLTGDTGRGRLARVLRLRTWGHIFSNVFSESLWYLKKSSNDAWNWRTKRVMIPFLAIFCYTLNPFSVYRQ